MATFHSYKQRIFRPFGPLACNIRAAGNSCGFATDMLNYTSLGFRQPERRWRHLRSQREPC